MTESKKLNTKKEKTESVWWIVVVTLCSWKIINQMTFKIYWNSKLRLWMLVNGNGNESKVFRMKEKYLDHFEWVVFDGELEWRKRGLCSISMSMREWVIQQLKLDSRFVSVIRYLYDKKLFFPREFRFWNALIAAKLLVLKSIFQF